MNEQLSDRVPPHDEDAEMAVLGSVLLDPSCFPLILPLVRPQDFYSVAHQHIWEAIIDLYDDRGACDLFLLQDWLDTLDLLVKCGGTEYLTRILENVPSSANAEHYAEIIQEKARLRGIIVESNKMLRCAYEQKPIDEFLPSGIRAISDQLVGGFDDIIPISDVVIEVVKRADAKESPGIATGFPSLDRSILGFRPTLIVLAAPQSTGKSLLAKNIALNMAKKGKKVLWVSLEDLARDVTRDLICIEGGIDTYHIYNPRWLTEEEWGAYTAAANRVAELPIDFTHDHGLTAPQIRAYIARLVATTGVDIVFVDYLQVIRRPGKEGRDEEVGEVARILRATALDFEIPVVALCQLNRKYAERKDHRPQLSDLRESGSLEQIARVALLLHRESEYKDDPQLREDLRRGIQLDDMEVIIAKNTVGARNITLHFDVSLPHLQVTEPEGIAKPGEVDF